MIYQSLVRDYSGGATLHVRAAGDPASLVGSVREAVRETDPTIPTFAVRTLRDQLQQSLWAERLGAALLGVFGMLAVALAAIGIYGVMSYSITQRRQEIGIRMALGAARRDVLSLVLGQSMVLVLFGLGIGLAAAFLVTRQLASLLHGISGTDAATYVGTPALLAAVALVASYFPARAATRVDPLRALRYE
jgi:ABC-type antimicrobial peptide transport system permease subunit